MKQYKISKRITPSLVKKIIAGSVGADDDYEPFIVMKSKTIAPLFDLIGWEWHLVANPLRSSIKNTPVCAYRLSPSDAKRIITNCSMHCVSSDDDGFIYEKDGRPFYEKFKGKGNMVARFD